MAIDIGPRIGIEGEAEYRRQINQIITQSKTLSSEMRVVASSFTAETTAEEKAAKTAEVLSKQVDTQKEKVKLLSDQLEKSRQKYGDNSEKTLKWQQAVNNATADLNKMERELSDSQKVADGYGQEVDDATKSTKEFDQTAQLLAKQQLAEFWSKAADAARKVADAAMNAAKELDKGYDTIVKKTGATGDELQNLKDVANDVYGSMAVDMADVGEAVGEVSTRFKVNGDALEDLSREFLQFASITGTSVSDSVDRVDRLMKIYKVDAEDTASVMGLLAKASQETGIKTDQLMSSLDSNGATLQELGFDLISATNLLAAFEANGVDTAGAMTALKKSVQNAAKQGKDANDVLAEAEISIRNAKDETEALQIASDIFGTKGAIVMAQGIRDGRISLDKATESIEKYADVVEKTYKETVSPWDETKIALNNLKTVGSELAGMALQTLVPAIQKVTNVIKGITEWFQKLSPTAQKVVGVITALAAGAAILGPKIMTVVQTMSMFKAASLASAAAQAAQTAATAAQTTATVGATAAQDALNASMWANPFVWLIAGIAALAGGLAIYAENADWAGKRMTDLNKELEQSNSAYEEQRQSVIDDREEVERLTKRVKDLQKKEALSVDEKTEMAAAVKKLNDLMPELNLNLDKESGKLVDQTGAIIENTEALDENFDAAKRRYELEHQQEWINAALDSYYENQTALNEAQAEYNRLKAEQDALDRNDNTAANTAKFIELQKAMNAANEVIEEATAGMETAQADYDSLTASAGELAEAEEEVSEAVTATSDAIHEATNRIQYEQTVYDGFAKSVIQAYEDMKNAVANSIESQISWLDKYEAAQTVNADTIEQNLTDQIKGVEDWQENIVKLADMGINQGLLKYLMDMGPKGAGYIKGLVEGGAEQLGRINKLWADAMNVQGLATETGTEVKRVIQGLIPDFESLGYNAGAGFASGLTKSQVLATQAASAMAHASIDTSKNILGIASPSKVFEYFGEMVGEGFEQGISATMPSMNGILNPYNDVGMFSGRGVNSLDPDAIYSAVRNGAENAQTKIIISGKEFGRLLRGMGVAIA